MSFQSLTRTVTVFTPDGKETVCVEVTTKEPVFAAPVGSTNPDKDLPRRLPEAAFKTIDWVMPFVTTSSTFAARAACDSTASKRVRNSFFYLLIS